MGDPYTLHFGMGTSSIIDSVVVKWPVSPPIFETFKGLDVNHAYTLFEGGQVVITGQGEKEIRSDFNVYPNPANEQITISTYLKNTSDIELTIREITGSEIINILPSTRIQSGSFSCKITERDLGPVPSGVYLICLKINGLEQVKKLILIK